MIPIPKGATIMKIKRIALCGLLICSAFISTSCSQSVLIEKADVDNLYNNRKVNVSTELVQIKDKLYYHHSSRFGEAQNYEIGSGYTKKAANDLPLDYVYHDSFLNPNTNPVSYYDENIDDVVIKEIPKDVSLNNCEVINNTIYFDTADSIVFYDGNEIKLFVTAKELGMDSICLNNAYINGTDVYYLYSEPKTEQSTIYKFNTVSKDKQSIGIGTGFYYNVIGIGNVVYYMKEGVLYKYDLGSKSTTVLSPQTQDSYISAFNICDGIICVSDEQGIYVSEFQNDSTFKKISDDEALNIYFLDSQYIYYIKQEGVLMRVLRDGSKTEKVFG